MHTTQNVFVGRYVDDGGRVCVTLKGAARLLCVHDASVRWLITSGQLSSTRRQVGRERWPRHLIPLDAVLRIKRERGGDNGERLLP